MRIEPQLHRLREALRASARAAAGIQSPDGSMPAGHNGPHDDVETPLRATSNWLQVFLWAWHDSGDAKYRECAHRCVEYLLESRHRPTGSIFLCREITPKLRSNGPIGQAWVVDALASAARADSCDDCARVAAEAVMAHPFDESLGLWHAVEVDGTSRGVYTTLNQQIWLAAAASRLPPASREGAIDRRIDRFISQLPRYVDLRADGTVCHILGLGWRARARRLAARFSHREKLHRQDRGYHTFLLAGVARLLRTRSLEPGSRLRAKIRHALFPLLDEEWRGKLDEDPFSWSYNPTGFEAAFVLLALRDLLPDFDVESAAAHWVSEQLDRHFDESTGLMNRATGDPATLSSRISEAIDLIANGRWHIADTNAQRPTTNDQ